MKLHYCDTYALIEILEENPNYLSLKDKLYVTSRLNLLELHYHLLKKFDLKCAEDIFKEFRERCVLFEDEDYKLASLFRYKYKKMKFSYIDCLGYIYSLRNNFPFVTGDNAFEGFDNVLFLE